MSTQKKHKKKVTISTLQAKKRKNEKITMLTAYDATFARLIDKCNIDSILVGDSLGMVIQGHENTIPVTVEDIIYHLKAVKRGTKSAHIIADMPFLSYQASIEDALRNAGRMIKDGGAHAVKLEGGLELLPTIKALTDRGIPVMAHIGLKPQSIHIMGGYKFQGKTEESCISLVNEAVEMQKAGAYALLLEGIAIETSREITNTVKIPTIGIGAGPHCDGQVLVIYDLLGMNNDFSPKFVKKYSDLEETISAAVTEYKNDVQKGAFPTKEHGVNRK